MIRHSFFQSVSQATVLVALLITVSQPTDAEDVVSRTEAALNSVTRSGEDWPEFLGPQQTGVSSETGLLDRWPDDGPPLLWSKSIGTGYSAPSIRGGLLVVHHRPRQESLVTCLEAITGKLLWEYAYESEFSDPYGYNNGPRCSPLLTENRCYTLGAEGKLLCLNLLNGTKVWERDLYSDFDIPAAFFGVGATPILEENKLIVLVGGQPNSGVVAFDPETGATLWESVGRSTWDNTPTGDPRDPVYRWTGKEMVVSYSSPVAVTLHGKRHVLCLMRQGLVSVDPDDGGVNFKYFFRATVHESVNAARPTVFDDKVFLSAAYRVGSALLRVHEDGKHYDVVWRDSTNMLTHWSTSIYLDGFLYGFSGRHEREGTLRCLDAQTGKVVWSTSGFEGDLESLGSNPATGQIVDRATGEVIPWPFYGRGSKILADNKFIVLGERGTLSLVKPDPRKWIEVSRISVPGFRAPTWAAPVLSRKRLYLRSENRLVCYDLVDPAKNKEDSP